ncbi:MAG TPA: redox-sensing transcriptional repressor Rex [Sediminispirochaeta sp.]|nr:redox-sensing transcriptional repressor Rex [Sediminispirochaeta sp.]
MSRIPLPSLKRLPRYLNVLESFQSYGTDTISATDIAEELDLKPIQIRKDMAFTGIVGKPKVGYDVGALIKAIRDFIGWNDISPAVLIGAGSLGTALMRYEGFAKRNLNIVAAFDKDQNRNSDGRSSTPVYPMERLPAIVAEHEIEIAILTVPPAAAQEVTDQLVKLGIRAIWNFSSAEIQVPPHVVVRREDLSEGLAVLCVQLHELDETREKK